MKIIGRSFEIMILNISLELKTIWTIPTYFILASKVYLKEYHINLLAQSSITCISSITKTIIIYKQTGY